MLTISLARHVPLICMDHSLVGWSFNLKSFFLTCATALYKHIFFFWGGGLELRVSSLLICHTFLFK